MQSGRIALHAVALKFIDGAQLVGDAEIVLDQITKNCVIILRQFKKNVILLKRYF